MKIYFMKQKAIDDMKANMLTLHPNYYKYSSNDWIYERFDYDPFEVFMEIPDFELAMLDDRNLGLIEFENCKILYEHLKMISPSQASDERLWAGLCNGTFYKYVRERWKYPQLKLKKPEQDASMIISRFFFKGFSRSGIYRNTLSKCWWVGRNTYDDSMVNHWGMLDAIGADDFSTKVSDIFYSNNFSSNREILKGICKAIAVYNQQKIRLSAQNNIRPALQYMNALGGSVLLDMLGEDEIAREFAGIIEKTRNGGDSEFIMQQLTVNDNDEDEELEEYVTAINLDYYDEVTNDVEQFTIEDVFGKVTKVIYGCKIKYIDSDGDEKILDIPEEEYCNLHQKSFVGRAIGDVVKGKYRDYNIVDIIL